MTTLNNKEYIKILQYYKQHIPKTAHLTKIHAEKIMAEKLCRCIKKLDPQNESKSIGICTKTIFNKHGFTRGNFQCKTKRCVTFRKVKKNSTNKNTKKSRKNK
jgi:hypothetical protein